MPKSSCSNTPMFSIRQIAVTILGSQLNWNKQTNKHKNPKNVSLNRSQKGHLLSVWEQNKKEEHYFVQPQQGTSSTSSSWMLGDSSFSLSTQIKTVITALQVLVLGLQINFSKQIPWILKIKSCEWIEKFQNI